MKCCYVGKYEFCPIGGLDVCNFPKHHPTEFKKLVDELDIHIWTNNPDIVNCFPPENVFVCGENGMKCLTEHPQFNTWKDELASGEMWSIWGEKWIVK